MYYRDYRDSFTINSRIRDIKTGEIGIVVDVTAPAWPFGNPVNSTVTYHAVPDNVWAKWPSLGAFAVWSYRSNIELIMAPV